MSDDTGHMAKSVLDRIYEALRDAGKPATQTQIADMLHIKQPSVSEWKTSLPSLRHALTLAHKLNVCVEWIYTERGPKRPGAPLEGPAQELWDLWPRLPEATRQQILGHAKMTATNGPPPKKTPLFTPVRLTRRS